MSEGSSRFVGRAALRHLDDARANGGSGCWLWPGPMWPTGYGRCNGPDGEVVPHRLAWKTWVGPIPEGMTIDHLCHTKAFTPCVIGVKCQHRRCVNPAHMELVSRRENSRRMHRHLPSGKCKHGHSHAEHGRRTPRGSWQCGECARLATTRCDRARGHQAVNDWSVSCPHGHDMTGDNPRNLRISPKGIKCCRACERENGRARAAARRAAA